MLSLCVSVISVVQTLSIKIGSEELAAKRRKEAQELRGRAGSPALSPSNGPAVSEVESAGPAALTDLPEIGRARRSWPQEGTKKHKNRKRRTDRSRRVEQKATKGIWRH